MSWKITPSYNGLIDDPDANAYLARVQSADGQLLEPSVRFAVNNFIKGCKADGIWSAIKACCILAGARTLAGALVPLVGPAPTNFSFVSVDYNRKIGLMGDGSTKYLLSNILNTSLNAQNHSFTAYVNALPSTTSGLIDLGRGEAGATGIHFASGNFVFRSANETFFNRNAVAGFVGLTRNSSASFTSRRESTNQSHTVSPGNLRPGNVTLYRFSEGIQLYANARLSFYSIGEALDLALLDARVTALINAFAAAIP